jgi:GTP cyclohydrolase I
MDRRAAERAIADFLRALGRNAEDEPELRETPARVVEAFADELLAGYAVDVPALISGGSTLASGGGDVVALRDISLATVCPHHLMPGIGRANVVYRPGERVLGLGAIARLVEAYAQRLALQETIGANVVRALVEHAGARGAYCEITLVHGCLSARGACQRAARATTLSRAGELTEAEVLLALARMGGNAA